MKKTSLFSFVGVFLLFVGVWFVSAQTHQGTLELNIEQGNSCCTYGSTINFGNKAISFSGYNFTGDFLSSIGTPMWSCIDMYGVETGWTMVVQMQGAMTSEAGNTIAESNVQISYGDTELIGGNCVPRVHSGVDVPLSSPVILLEKDGLNPANYGSVCAMQTNNVKMKVVVDPAQAPGNYTGTIVIDIPGFMSTCTGGMLVQGAVYDSEIEGLSYVGNFGSSGVTLSGGKFTYMIGETVSFSLGGMQIGSLVPATDRKIFLPEILGKVRTDLTDQKVVEVARLLQGLDQDNNVNNGITITSSDANAITETLSGSAINDKLISLGKPVKTAEQVVSHLEQTLTTSFTETGNVSYPWAVKGGSTSADLYYKSMTDTNGNTYAVGYFQATANFGSNRLVSSGGYDALLTKTDTNGNWLWAIKGGAAGNDWIQDLFLTNSGDIYVVGSFAQTARFGSFSLVSPTGTSSFLAKVDTNGNWTNAKVVSTGNTSNVYQVTLDKDGNIYLLGSFISSLTIGGTPFVSSGGSDLFLTKLDPNRNYVWSKKIGATSTDSLWASPVTDNQGNIYVAAYFTGTLKFASTTLVASGYSDGYLAKLDASGNEIWIKQFSGNDYDLIMGLTIDHNQNTYVLAASSSTPLTVGSFSAHSLGSYDLMIAKITSQGDCLWLKRAGGTSLDYYYSLRLGVNNDLYAVGYVSGTGMYGSYPISNVILQDISLARISLDGNWLGAWNWGSGYAQYGRDVGLDGFGNVYISSRFSGGPATIGNTVLTNSGGDDVSILKIPYRQLY